MTMFTTIMDLLHPIALGWLIFQAFRYTCGHDWDSWRLRRKWRGVDERLLDKQQQLLYAEFVEYLDYVKSHPQDTKAQNNAASRVVIKQLAKYTMFIAARRNNELKGDK